MSQPFKDVLNRWRTNSLFVEFQHPDYPAYFTLDENDRTIDGITYLSLKRKYLEYADPTEHRFAQALFGSFPCWENLSTCPAIAPHVAQWRKELELALRGEAIAILRSKTASGDVTAAKALAALAGPAKAHRSPGRPRKAGSQEPSSPEADHSSAWDRTFGPAAPPKVEVN